MEVLDISTSRYFRGYLIVTLKYSSPLHIPTRLRTQRRHKLLTRHQWPWCRQQEAENSEYWLALLTWPARLLLQEPRERALPCDPARMTSMTRRLSWSKVHTPSQWRMTAVWRTRVWLSNRNMFLKINWYEVSYKSLMVKTLIYLQVSTTLPFSDHNHYFSPTETL